MSDNKINISIQHLASFIIFYGEFLSYGEKKEPDDPLNAVKKLIYKWKIILEEDKDHNDSQALELYEKIREGIKTYEDGFLKIGQTISNLKLDDNQILTFVKACVEMYLFTNSSDGKFTGDELVSDDEVNYRFHKGYDAETKKTFKNLKFLKIINDSIGDDKVIKLLLSMIMNDLQSTNSGNNDVEVNFSGMGSEFNQGFISKEEYNNWLELKDNIFWNQFCEDNLEKDGYWDISDVSSFTAINRDLLKIEIKINNKSFFDGSFDELIDKYFSEEGEILNSKNESSIYGANNLPDNWDTFFKNEEFNKRDKVLVTTKTSENFSVNGELKISDDFNIKKFGLIVLSTDEMGYGVDFGDYVLGFRYEDENVDCEFPGGVGNLEAPSFA